MRNSENVDIFGKRLLEFIRPSHNSTFYICNPYCITLLTRLCIGLNHLNEHKFKHGFNDTVNVICVCECAVESINLFLSVLNLVKQGKPSLAKFKGWKKS